MRRSAGIAALCMWWVAAAGWSAPFLNAGQPAPALTGVRWLQGKGLTSAGPGGLRMVWFWSTDSQPCQECFEPVAGMARTFAGKVAFASVCVREKGGPQSVQGFLKALGQRMPYTAGIDTSGAADRAWIQAAKESQVPMGFLIDKAGKVVWIGHPLAGLHYAITQVQAGKWNTAAFARDRAQEKADNERYGRITRMSGAGKHKEALADLDDWMRTDPRMAKRMVLVRFDLLMKANEAEAYRYGRVLLTGELRDQSGMLWLMARMIVDDNPILRKPDYKLALDLAQRATDLTQQRDANILTALAYAHFKLGHVDTAIELQQKAMPIAAANKEIPDRLKEQMKQRLELFRRTKTGR